MASLNNPNAPEKNPVDSPNPQTAAHNRGSNSPPGIRPPDSESPPPPESNDEAYKRRQERRDRWRLGIEVLAFCVLSLYTCAAFLQRKAILESNSINREALTSVQRAFVTPQGIQAIGADGSWQFGMQWKNSGTTPTKNARGFMNFRGTPESLPDDFSFPDLENLKPTPVVIGPNATLLTGQVAIPPERIRAVQERKIRLYFWGWMEYNDIFQRTPLHVEEFCRELTQVLGNPMDTSRPMRLVWRICPHHNCSDEQCEDYQQRASRDSATQN